MGIFSRLSDIVNSNINAILARAEDPEKIIRLIIQEMEDTLVEVRSAAVRGIAERKELERRAATLRREVEEWDRKAELAVTKGRDDLARGALHAKSRSELTLRELESATRSACRGAEPAERRYRSTASQAERRQGAPACYYCPP